MSAGARGRGHGVAGGRVAFLLTCEHGGNDVPSVHRYLFEGADDVLASHRGWDAGALNLARALSRELDAPLHASDVTRLLLDLNRSPHHARVFSEFSRRLPREERARLLRTAHGPYRRAVDGMVADLVEAGRVVIHVGVHTFAPVLDGVARRADAALLYDPARDTERAYAHAWVRTVKERRPGLRVRRNYPYRGASDGLTTWLRGRHPGTSYLGLELEVSQGLLDADGAVPEGLCSDAAGALLAATESIAAAAT